MIIQRLNQNPELKAALDLIRSKFAEDPLYYKAWQMTMATMFYKRIDRWAERHIMVDISDKHDESLVTICNEAARDFIDWFINDPAKHRADELELLSPPGDTIKETMEALGIDFPLFVIKMGISAEGAKNLLDGKAPLTEAIARRLELTLNLDAQFWLNREANYRGKLKQLNT